FAIILTVDSLVVIPFPLIRANEQLLCYVLIILASIGVMVGFTLLFIVIFPYIVKKNLLGAEWIQTSLRFQDGSSNSSTIPFPEVWIGYASLANLSASVVTL